MDGQLDGEMGRQRDEWKEGQTDIKSDRWIDQQMDGLYGWTKRCYAWYGWRDW